ncbi:MAG: hypothetical protein HYS25_13740 [Ignavibacteriales bacterium]|nr:hypothetical protein [Ignavibacteriales bacterium]
MNGERDLDKRLSTWQCVDSVVQLILENERYLQKKRYLELAKNIAEKFSVSLRTAKRYIAEARKEINRIGKAKTEKALVKAVRDREYLLHAAKYGLKDRDNNYIMKPNHKLALEILKDREDLKGLYTERIDHKVTLNLNGYDLGRLTDEQLSIVEGMVKRGEDPRNYLTALGIYVGSLD